MINPELELYNAVYLFSQDSNFNTYDVLPDLKAEYPFVIVNASNMTISNEKTALGGKIYINIDIWGTQQQIAEVSNISNTFMSHASHDISTEHFKFVPVVDETSKQTVKDNSVENTILNHVILELCFRF